MSSSDAGHASHAGGGGTRRREGVLEAALTTFARFGYRKTSMEAVARAADISRPGLYFLFSSKEELFRAAVTKTLERDLAAVERILAEAGRPLAERLVAAFDQWAGRYVGPLAREVTEVIEANPVLLGDVVETSPRKFEELVVAALVRESGREAAARAVAQTLISASIGLKYQAPSREFFVERLRTAVGLLTH